MVLRFLVLPASFAFVIKDYLDQRKINHKYFIILAVGFLLVVPGFILFSAHDYFNVTYGYITHGDEDITITPISWFNLWKNNYFPGSIGSLFLISLVGLIMILLYRHYKQFRNPFLLLKNQLFFFSHDRFITTLCLHLLLKDYLDFIYL